VAFGYPNAVLANAPSIHSLIPIKSLFLHAEKEMLFIIHLAAL